MTLYRHFKGTFCLYL